MIEDTVARADEATPSDKHRLKVFDAYDRIGVHFVPLNQHPLDVKNVADVKEAMREFRPEIEWAIEAIDKYKGYGIALPQIGVPLNVAVVRFRRDVKPGLAFNLAYFADKTKKTAMSLEADYSLGKSVVFFTVNRWRKIKAQWMDGDGQMHTKVMKIPARAQELPAGVVFQNIADHMLPAYPMLLKKKIERHMQRNADALGTLLAEAPELRDE